MPQMTIWDRVPSVMVAMGSADVPGNTQGWVSARLEGADTLEPDHSCRVALGPAASVAWTSLPSLQSSTRSGPLGTVANYFTSLLGGPEPQHADLPVFSNEEVDPPAYEYWRQYRKDSHALRLSPEQHPYEPRFAINAWAGPEQFPNAWLSEPVLAGGPQHPRKRVLLALHRGQRCAPTWW